MTARFWRRPERNSHCCARKESLDERTDRIPIGRAQHFSDRAFLCLVRLPAAVEFSPAKRSGLLPRRAGPTWILLGPWNPMAETLSLHGHPAVQRHGPDVGGHGGSREVG